MTILLDTSVVIDVLRNHSGAMAFVAALPDRPYLSVVTICELRAGERNTRERALIDAVLQASVTLGIDAAVAEVAGKYMQRFRKSHAVETADALIAATATHSGIGLATLNIKHFPMFPDLKRPY